MGYSICLQYSCLFQTKWKPVAFKKRINNRYNSVYQINCIKKKHKQRGSCVRKRLLPAKLVAFGKGVLHIAEASTYTEGRKEGYGSVSYCVFLMWHVTVGVNPAACSRNATALMKT